MIPRYLMAISMVLNSPNQIISDDSNYIGYHWAGTHDVGLDPTNTDFNQSLSAVVVDDPGRGYSVPISVRVWGGYPELGLNSMFINDTALGVGQDLALQGPVAAIQYKEAEFHVIEVDENGSITKLEMVNGDGGFGYIPWWTNSAFPSFEFPHVRFPSEYSVDENGTLCVTGRSGIKGWAVDAPGSGICVCDRWWWSRC